jgi:hypothetical protein
VKYFWLAASFLPAGHNRNLKDGGAAPRSLHLVHLPHVSHTGGAQARPESQVVALGGAEDQVVAQVGNRDPYCWLGCSSLGPKIR